MVRLWFLVALPVRVSGRIWVGVRFRGSGTEFLISAPNAPIAIPNKSWLIMLFSCCFDFDQACWYLKSVTQHDFNTLVCCFPCYFSSFQLIILLALVVVE
ncbi:hypothetical protein RHMOL_RhmolUnG0000100 [Rhododendron molle]|nr:hypothetical protein RHMOL_RhmolUnG0000100 [Rhododendron molle]